MKDYMVGKTYIVLLSWPCRVELRAWTNLTMSLKCHMGTNQVSHINGNNIAGIREGACDVENYWHINVWSSWLIP